MINENNKEILDHLVSVNPIVKQLTYIELGIFLDILDYHTDFVSLVEAHEYLGSYKNEEIDSKIKQLLDEGRIREVDKMIVDKVQVKK